MESRPVLYEKNCDARDLYDDNDESKNIILEAFYLTKNYSQVKALDTVSLSLKRGEIFGLVGPNGAGKTTLLKILATLLNPDDGSATIDGIVLEDKMAVRRIIGYAPDVLGVYDELTVYDYLEFFVMAYSIKQELQSFLIEDTMELVGITELSGKPVDGLSRGMKQRLSLARALLHRPKLLILDEPASGLDPLARLELRQILKTLRKRGVTILISSHVLSDLSDICDRIGIMQKGRLVSVDRTEAFLKKEEALRVRLRVNDREEEAMQILNSFEDVSGALWDGRDIVFKFNNESAGLANINKALVLSDVPVTLLQVEDTTLEDVYLEITGQSSERFRQSALGNQISALVRDAKVKLRSG